MRNTLFADIFTGKKEETVIETLTLDVLKNLSNAASSKKTRAANAKELARATVLKDKITAKINELSGDSNKAEWRTKSVDNLTIEDVERALKQARWYKTKYGIKMQKQWKAVITEGNKEDPFYAKAQHNLEVAEVKYPQALKDEEYWLNIRETRFAGATVANKLTKQQSELQTMIDMLESKTRLNKTEEDMLQRLKSML